MSAADRYASWQIGQVGTRDEYGYGFIFYSDHFSGPCSYKPLYLACSSVVTKAGAEVARVSSVGEFICDTTMVQLNTNITSVIWKKQGNSTFLCLQWPCGCHTGRGAISNCYFKGDVSTLSPNPPLPSNPKHLRPSPTEGSLERGKREYVRDVRFI